jgi:hypothetical protein
MTVVELLEDRRRATGPAWRVEQQAKARRSAASPCGKGEFFRFGCYFPFASLIYERLVSTTPPALCLLCRPEVEEERKKIRMKKKGGSRGGRRGRS